MDLLRTYIYIDGFNLYYGQVKGTPYKWLDLDALCRAYLSAKTNNILKIKYFTAIVKPRPKDPDQGVRQQIYIRALKTIPHIEIIYGHFLSHEVNMPLAGICFMMHIRTIMILQYWFQMILTFLKLSG